MGREGAGVEQLGEGAEAGAAAVLCLSVLLWATDPLWRLQVRPVRGDERTTTVGEDQQQVQSVVPMRPTQQPQRLPFKRMAWTDDGDRSRKTLEVGSVSWCPSTPFRMET